MLVINRMLLTDLPEIPLNLAWKIGIVATGFLFLFFNLTY